MYSGAPLRNSTRCRGKIENLTSEFLSWAIKPTFDVLLTAIPRILLTVSVVCFQGQHARDEGHSVRRLRGHLRREESVRSPVWLQRVQPLPRGAVLPEHQGEHTYTHTHAHTHTVPF